MTAVWLAVMEDDSVLCTDCLHEHRGDSVSETAASIVHAWLADPVGEACECCGARDDSQTAIGGGGGERS